MEESGQRIGIWRGKAESASEYDRGIGDWVTVRETELILALLGKPNGMLLDFPCGSGRLSRSLMNARYKVIAADLLPDMAAFTRDLVDRRVLQANIFEPPFRPRTFNTILAVRIFFHYPDQTALLTALAELLAPGGRLIFDTLNPFSTRRLLALFLDSVRRDTNRRLVFSPPARILCLTRKLGLKLEARKGLHLLPTRVYQHLPNSLLWLLHRLERRTADDHRVSTFWAFCLPSDKRNRTRAG